MDFINISLFLIIYVYLSSTEQGKRNGNFVFNRERINENTTFPQTK